MINWVLGKSLVEGVAKKIIEEATTELKNRIERDTPVGNPSLWKYKAPADYIPGTLKKSWVIKYEGGTVKIINDQPYAYRIEYGWSGQAPAGMVRINIADFSGILNDKSKGYKI